MRRHISPFLPAPLFPALKLASEQMKIKDAALYEQVRYLPIKDARKVWRAKYPEDLVDEMVDKARIVH